MEKETIIDKAYQLLKSLIPFLNKLPRSQKFVYGDRIQNFASDLLEVLLEAFYAAPTQKKELLAKANLILEKMRFFMRIGYDLGYFSNLQRNEFIVRIDEIGRMIGGWIKSLKA